MNPLDDYISQCMDDTGVQAKIPEFENAFCQRCLNPQCKRSKMNSLLWKQRMNRQVTALHNPDFADPTDPVYRELAAQAFKTFDKQTVHVTDWESFSEPERFKKAPTVHHAEPELESRSGEKVEDNVNLLATAKGKKASAKTLPEEPPAIEEHPEDPEVVTPAPQPEKETSVPEKKSLATQPRGQYNTEVPEGGILLKPREEILKPSNQAKSPAHDQWSLKPEKKKLVVRASDGKKVTKVDREES